MFRPQVRKRNCRFEAFSAAQREYVVLVLNCLAEIHAAEIEENLDSQNLFRTIAIWKNANVAWYAHADRSGKTEFLELASSINDLCNTPKS